MPLLNKKTIIFDIDETLLSAKTALCRLNETLKEKANFDPYNDYFGGSFAINRPEMSKIFKGILDNKDEIAFVTAGSITREEIKNFCKNDYNVELPEGFQHCNLTIDKTPALHQIKGDRNPRDIVFVDNSMSHITPARAGGFRTVYADNNLGDKTNGTKYISELKQFIQERKNEIAQEKKAVIALDEKGLLDNNNFNLIKNNEVLQTAVFALHQKGLLADNFELIKDKPDLQKAVVALEEKGLLDNNNFNLIKNNHIRNGVLAISGHSTFDSKVLKSYIKSQKGEPITKDEKTYLLNKIMNDKENNEAYKNGMALRGYVNDIMRVERGLIKSGGETNSMITLGNYLNDRTPKNSQRIPDGLKI